MKEKTEILWAYEHRDVVEQQHVFYRTGSINPDVPWPNQSCKEDDLDLFYFRPRLIHYKEALSQTLLFVFPISLRHFTGGQSTSLSAYRRQIAAFDWIPSEVLEACRRGQCVLYFEDRYEGYPDWYGIQIKYFNDLAKRLNIGTDKIIVSTGNAKMSEVAEKYNTGLTFVHEDWFRTEFWARKLYYNPRLEHDVVKKQKLYLCYNRHWNDNRQRFVYELWRQNLLEHGYVSLPAATAKQARQIKRSDYWLSWVPNMIDVEDYLLHMDQYLNTLPLILDTPTFDNMAHQSNNAHYQETYISVVTETWGENTTAFFTEKIYKAVMAEHPFMVLSGQHFLRYFRQQGFKTYDGLLDESYDDATTEGDRARLIVKELKRLSVLTKAELDNFWQSTRDIAQHNRQTLEANPNYGKNLLGALSKWST